MKTGDIVVLCSGEPFYSVDGNPVYVAVVNRVFGDSEVELNGEGATFAPTLLRVLCSADGTGDCGARCCVGVNP